jgi:tRNA uridine 5-carbamoylmethylation protein Kti12
LVSKNFLICLVGLPASGKSTFAKILKTEIKKKYKEFHIKIIDPDIIRQKLTPNEFDFEKEHIIRKENLKKIRYELNKGHIVISDDLNYYSSMRHDLKNITDMLNINFFVIHITTPIEICLKWNNNRGTPIPNMVINKIHEKFDKFNKYRWDVKDTEYDLSKMENLNHLVEDFLEKIVIKRENMKSELKIIKIKNDLSNLDNKNLDKLTRIYVGKLLQNSSYLPLKKSIIKLRKNYVRLNKNKALKEPEISKFFKLYLENNLHIKISEDLL